MAELGSPEVNVDSGATLPIFVSDASAEAERVTEVLRQRGYQVVDVPLGLLLSRLAAQRPALILCDADAPDALDTITRSREVPGAERVEVIFIGEPGKALERHQDALFHEASGVFYRPVEMAVLLRKVEALIGPPRGKRLPPLAPSRSPVLVPSARKPVRSDVTHEPVLEPGRAQQVGAISESEEAAEPEANPFAFIPESEMSAQLTELLAEAELRLGELPPVVTTRTRRLRPEVEVEAVLPEDILSGLDEELDLEDEMLHANPVTAGGPQLAREAGRPETPVAEPLAASARGSAPSALPDTPKPGVFDPRQAVTTPPPPGRSPGSSEAARRVASENPPSDLGTRAITRQGEPAWQSATHGAVAHPDSAPSVTSLGSARPKDLTSTTPPKRPSVTHTETLSKPVGESRSEGSSEGPSTPRQSIRGTHSPLLPERAEPSPSDGLLVPADLIATLANLIRSRYSGGLALDAGEGLRRIVLRDGDFVIVSSGAREESLVAYLVSRGSLSPEAALQIGHRLPQFGRHAGAALVAHGHLRQDELWSVLRAHAEWLLVALVSTGSVRMVLEQSVPERLREEPAVFGGATGAEVLVDLVRRAIEPVVALEKMGGTAALVWRGPAWHLLSECPLEDKLLRELRQLGSGDQAETLVSVLLERLGYEQASTIYALQALQILNVRAQARVAEPLPLGAKPEPSPQREDPLDREVLRSRVASRRSLIDQGDYFAVLGVSRTATAYDIQRAYVELRQEFDPVRISALGMVDLKDDVETILEVLQEAHDILSDPARRERYRRALEAGPA